MSTIALPAGLPSGVDPSTADMKQVTGTPGAFVGGNATQITYAVPTGEAWLFQSVITRVTSVAPGSSREFVQILDQNSLEVWQTSSATSITAPQIYHVSLAPGMPETDTSGNPQPVVSFGIPWLVLLPGWKLLQETDFSGAGTSFYDQVVQQAIVTYWVVGTDWTTPSPEPLGPFMYVPGPSASAV